MPHLYQDCVYGIRGTTTDVNKKLDLMEYREENLLPLPAGASAALVKPTKYHYYPHNQHIYLLPECAIQQRALTLVKTCEPTAEMRLCRSPRDWSLLALQNIRSGKSHYLVICRCPETSILEGPMSHDQPTYASVPGIRVYGMMCVDGRRDRQSRISKSMDKPQFPWDKAVELARSAIWD
ncbi:unnamed protein product [Diabrotica balteata]|uniref:Uncharacterized protein n=1 Tax=Diabrotica balteata TaxID=107213 RepID=A0A9N9SVJ6_DIABA|nr:unnamed protein product [Diabrotica balteata]